MKLDNLKIMISFGTRPEAIKLAPLIKDFCPFFKCIIVNTGQHTELLNQVLTIFKISPHFSLGCQDIDLLKNFYFITQKIREVVSACRPDLIIVQGDTLSTFAVAFAGFTEKIPLVHLEAGLRSRNKFAPFPEEMYRILTDDLADIYLAPTLRARENLLREGKSTDRVYIVGNTVIDALNYLLQNIEIREAYSRLLKDLNLIEGEYLKRPKVLITAHRRENIGDPLRNICKAIKKLCKSCKEALFIWLLHKNPMVREIIFAELTNFPENLILTEALSYDLTLLLMKDSVMILTDSGGIQEEATAFKKPVLILRETTERWETVEAGFGFLVGNDPEKIVTTFESLILNSSFLAQLENRVNPYGDGRATERIIKLFNCEKFYYFIKSYPYSIKEDLNECKNVVEEFIYTSVPTCP